jgi:hypothetical protein
VVESGFATLGISQYQLGRASLAHAAHLTRTFYQIFGIPPSVIMRGEFFEIPSPFAASA